MSVSQAEREMIDLAIALVDGSDPRLHSRRLTEPGKATGLSPETLAALERVLVCGVSRELVGGGGAEPPWRSEGRLAFGSATLDLLHWLHVAKVNDAKRPELTLRAPMRPLDALLAARAIELVAAVPAPIPQAWAKSPWLWLFAGEHLAPAGPPPATLPWAEVLAEGWLIDALPRRLHRIWSSWVRTARAVDVEGTIAHGEAQERVLSGFLGAIDRPERAGFAAELIVELSKLPVGVWNLERGKEPLSRWQRGRRARVGAIRAACAAFGAWGAQWRSVGFVDDDFRQVQGYLRRFETALAAARDLEPPIARAEQLPDEATATA